ncbi:TRAP transporter small permease subunit [Phaeobacter sp. J2-8]|uniref:TRAP transporter small permease n=1 Tax=Phaeobacter sp. J2-8 TaxID=2931394 RepID=UPI001FCF8A92|nr:TRAP transporter small permease subunit [Phaeobacter sp. J2-8]MCJ7873369.1 TRAP transporter small permease subunit [Phaeobacter sp. J2-8]
MIGWLLRIALFVPVAFLVIATGYAVVLRYWAGAPLHWMEEASGIALIWIVMIGAIAAERDNEQLSIPIFVEAMSRRGQVIVKCVIGILSVGLLALLAYYGVTLAEKVAFKLTGVLKISWYWIDIAVPVGFVGIILCYIAGAWRMLRADRETQE